MEVTGLKTNARVPNYITVVIDGTRFASLPVATVAQMGLQVGTLIDEKLRLRLEEVAEIENAYLRAVRMLGIRPRAVNDLMRRLRAKGHNPSACAEAVGRLEVAGELDDEKFARLFATQKVARRFGRSRILADLLSQGVDGRIAEVAIDMALMDQDTDPLIEIRGLAAKKMRQMKGLDRTKQKRRLLGYLARRGFCGGDVWAIVDEALDDPQ
jgi:regulatory protein